MIIRQATEDDLTDLIYLMKELGYPTTLEKLKLRYRPLFASENDYILVAESDGKVIGMAGCHTTLFYEYDGLYLRLAAFVIDSAYRSQGIGRTLLESVENLARDLGANAVILNSGNKEERKGAHLYYTSMGYRAKSTGFVKPV